MNTSCSVDPDFPLADRELIADVGNATKCLLRHLSFNTNGLTIRDANRSGG